MSSPEEYRYLKENRITVNNEGDTISTEKPFLPYGYVNPNDIIWAQVVWEVIDLNQKMNQPYFYSSSDVISNSPYSLFEALQEGIERNDIRSIYADEYFREKVTWEQVKKAFKVTRYQENEYCSELKESGSEDYDVECKLEFSIEPTDIRFIKVKGMWYVDKRIGEMRYRLLGIAPMGPDLVYLSSEAAAVEAVQNINKANAGASADEGDGGLFGGGDEGEEDSDDGLFGGGDEESEQDDLAAETDSVNIDNNTFKNKMQDAVDNQEIKSGASKELFDLFWVYYPSARLTLNNYNVLNPSNLATKTSYDDMLNARKFHSVIYKVEDGFDRHVKDYYPDAIKQIDYDRQFRNKVIAKENIMWNY